jgi:outer membrane protein TolC
MLANALAHRPTIALAHAEAANAELRVANARNARLPRVDAFASFGASAGSVDQIGSDSTVGVVVSLDLFDGGRNARIASARAALDSVHSGEAMARDQVTMEVVTAWNRVRAARERIGVAKKSAESADAASRIVRDRYENGLTTITEHLRAQTALFTARLELLAARYDHVAGQAELLRASGGLDDVEAFQ